jgi:hypothetical protein
MPCDFGRLALRLVKFDCCRTPGEPDAYEVLLDDVRTQSLCSCKGFERHGWHKDSEGDLVSCKHLDACLKLVDDGHVTLPAKPAARSEEIGDYWDSLPCPAGKPANLEADFA